METARNGFAPVQSARSGAGWLVLVLATSLAAAWMPQAQQAFAGTPARPAVHRSARHAPRASARHAPRASAQDPARPAAAQNRVAPLQKRTYDLALSGNHIYLAVTGGLVVLRENHCRNPKGSRIRHCRVATFLREGALVLPDSANGLALRGRRLLLAQGTWGLGVVDVSRPAHPKLLAHLPLPGAAMSVAWEGKTAYVAMGAMGVAVVDMHRPRAPKLLSVVALGTDGYVWSVAVSHGTLLAATGRGGLLVLDVRRPKATKILAKLALPGEAREPAFLTGKRAVVAAGKGGLVLVDISAPTAPKVLSTLPTEDFGRGVGVSGKYVAMGEGQSGAMLAEVVGGKLKFLGRYWSDKLAVNDALVRPQKRMVQVYLSHDAGGLVRVTWRRGEGDALMPESRWPHPTRK